jgi:regulator of protease activity HflC (stomatin/prohibitin superfamily)
MNTADLKRLVMDTNRLVVEQMTVDELAELRRQRELEAQKRRQAELDEESE